MTVKAKPKVVVVGGGFAGLEATFRLHKQLRDQIEITLISDEEYFVFKPNAIYVPFGLDPRKLLYPVVKPLVRHTIPFVLGRAREIDPVDRLVHANGQTVPYDHLIVATGVGVRPKEIPGLKEHARVLWSLKDFLRLRSEFGKLRERDELALSGRQQQVLFLVPPGNQYVVPLYEMAFMLDTWLRRKKARENVDIILATYEEDFIQAFGARMHNLIRAEMDRRSIIGHSNFAVEQVEEKQAIFFNGRALPFDLLVAAPPYVAATSFPGLPADQRGFLRTDFATRQVVGHPEIYAVGDAGDFPVKQAFLACQQAEVAAEHIAAAIVGRQPRVFFEPLSVYVMDAMDKATFVQAPLRLTSSEERPVEVDAEASELYKIGTSPIWRFGKKLVGVYLPWRFTAGDPFHAGVFWMGMDAGLKLMSRALAE